MLLDHVVRGIFVFFLEQTERLGNLLEKCLANLLEQLSRIETDVVTSEFLLVKIAWKDDVLQFFQHSQNQMAFGKLRLPDFANMRMLGVTCQNRFQHVVNLVAHKSLLPTMHRPEGRFPLACCRMRAQGAPCLPVHSAEE